MITLYTVTHTVQNKHKDPRRHVPVPTSTFFKQESQRQRRKNIDLFNYNNKTCTTSQTILQAFRNCYKDLFTKEDIDETLFDEFLHDLPTLTDEFSNIRDGDITLQELTKALKSMKPGKVQDQTDFPRSST